MKVIQSKLGPRFQTEKVLWGFLVLTLCFLNISGLAIDRVSGRSLDDMAFFKGFLTPDGLLYTARTLEWLGQTPINVLADLRNLYSGTQIEVSTRAIIPPAWESALVDSRILYPFASIPFVYFLGPLGMLGVPILCYILIPLVTLFIAKSRIELRIAKVFCVAYCASFYTSYNLLKNTTEALASFLLLLFILLLVRGGLERELNLWSIHGFVIAILGVAVSATRQLDLVIISLYFIYFLFGPICGSWTRRASFFAIMTTPQIIWLIFSYNTYQNYAIVTRSDETQLGFNSLLLLEFFQNCIRVLVVEIGQFAIKDGIFFVSVIYLGYKVMSSRSKLLTGWTVVALLSALVLTTVNGSLGSGIRYFQPVLCSIGVIAMYSNRFMELRNSAHRNPT